jgi:divalent metal cation (Fe/Co/Zn/Cd) transporter
MIGLLLCCIAVVLGRETKNMLLGEAATSEDVAAIRAALASEGFDDVIHLRTVHLGPDDILVTVKVAQDASVTIADHGEQADRAEAAIRAAVPAVRLIYIEPDVRRAQA